MESRPEYSSANDLPIRVIREIRGQNHIKPSYSSYFSTQNFSVENPHNPS